jgi:hypothetical protein
MLDDKGRLRGLCQKLLSELPAGLICRGKEVATMKFVGQLYRLATARTVVRWRKWHRALGLGP